MRHVLEREQLVPRPRPEVFGFFADPTNLERLTPRSLRFKILSALPIEMRAGTLIDYEIALLGFPLRWRTLIESFEPGARFVDVQLVGPYRFWRHTHELSDTSSGTIVRDRVEYEVPLGLLGEVAWLLFVNRQLRHIFDFRRDTIDEIFGATGPARPGNEREASREHA